MTQSPVTKHTRKEVTPFTAAELRALQSAAKKVLGWTLDTLAEKAACSATELKFIRQGRRTASIPLTRRLRKVENDLAYCARDSETLDAQTVEWVIQVLERYAERLTVAQRSRMKRILRSNK